MIRMKYNNKTLNGMITRQDDDKAHDALALQFWLGLRTLTFASYAS